MQRRHLWVGGVVSGALVAIGVTVYFPANTLGEEFGRRAEARLGITLSASSSSFSLTRGIVLEGVTANGSSKNLVLSAEIGRLVVTHELSLQRPLRIKTIRLVRPTLTAIIGERGDWPRRPPDSIPDLPQPEERRSPEGSDVAELGIQSGNLDIDLELAIIEVRSPGADTYSLRATGLDVALKNVSHDGSAPSLVHALVGAGTLNARELWLGSALVEDASSELTLGGGHFLLSDLTFVCDGRDFFLSEVDIGFTSDPFSFGTRTNILERVQPDPSAPVEWVPVTSLRELDGLCGR